jgi:hypothetical protein
MKYFEQNYKETYRNAVTQITTVTFTDLDAQTELNRNREKFLNANAKNILKLLKKTNSLIIIIPKDKPDDNRKNTNDLIKNAFRETSIKTLRFFIFISNLIIIKNKRDLFKKFIKYIKILILSKPIIFINVESEISKFTAAIRN